MSEPESGPGAGSATPGESAPAGAMPASLDSVWRQAVERWGYGIDLSSPVALSGDAVAYIDLRTRQTHVNFARLGEAGLAGHLATVLAHEVGHHARYPQTLVQAAKLLLRLRRLLVELEEDRPGLPRVGKKLEPSKLDYLSNLFLDVLINDRLYGEDGDDFATIYRRLGQAEESAAASPPPPVAGTGKRAPESRKAVPEPAQRMPGGAKPGREPPPRFPPPSASFGLTMALYEALWQLGDGSPMLSDCQRARLNEVSPSWHEEAQALADGLRATGENLFAGQDLFVEAIWPYVVADLKQGLDLGPRLEEAQTAQIGGLEADELAEVARQTRDERAADQARKQRRTPVLVELPPDDPEGDGTPGRGPPEEDVDPDELGRILVAGGECGGQAADAPAAVLAYYERLADRLLIRLPVEPQPSPLVPTTLAEWEASDDPRAIDWLATLGRVGVAIPGLNLLRREYESEPADAQASAPPLLEIYIDSSGSMPDPSQRWSPLAFAGFLLTRAATQAGSQVRIVQYSGPGDVAAMEDFSADRGQAFRALLRYFGNGTRFPFALLAESVTRHRSRGRIVRVVLSDDDFLYNVRNPEKGGPHPLQVLASATVPPNQMCAVLCLAVLSGVENGVGAATAWPNQHAAAANGLISAALASVLPKGLCETGMQVLSITEWNQLHGVAVALGRRVFEGQVMGLDPRPRSASDSPHVIDAGGRLPG